MSADVELKGDVLTIEKVPIETANNGQQECRQSDSSSAFLASSTAEDAVSTKIEAIFAEKLNAPVPSATADLFATGILDSLALVRLLAYLEEEFALLIPIEELDLDTFRTFTDIVRLISHRAEQWRRPGIGQGISRAIETP
jgi:acyl carrier protein